MSKLLWLVGGTALALAVWAVINSENQGPIDSVDRAAENVGSWGAKNRVTGTGGNLFGKAEETFGKVTGDKSTQASGVLDQAVGTVKDAAGKAAQALGSKAMDANS